MGKGVRRIFSEDYKQEALRLCESRPIVEVARSLGISADLLHKWRHVAKKEGADAFRGNGNRTSVEEELRQLRLENKKLKEEQVILKKASAYFAQFLR